MAKFWNDIKEDIIANTAVKKPNWGHIVRMILLHPAIRVLFNYRVMKSLGEMNVFSKFIKRILWAANCFNSGCFLSPYCTIEPGVILVHPTGVVIGEGAIVEKGARIFQHVTIGTKSWQYNETAAVVEAGAVLYAGAIIAGSHTIGKGAVVGANAVVISDVPENALAVGVPAKIKIKGA